MGGENGKSNFVLDERQEGILRNKHLRRCKEQNSHPGNKMQLAVFLLDKGDRSTFKNKHLKR
jgi:hypothetical protein